MIITHKSEVAGYNPYVWFEPKPITNLIALKNIIKKYHVTYGSLYEMFIFHREEHGKNDMYFRMHESVLHYYDPEGEYFVFFNTVTGEKESYSKRQIKAAE